MEEEELEMKMKKKKMSVWMVRHRRIMIARVVPLILLA